MKDIERNDILNEIGKPEALRGNLAGLYSRRIDEANRLIYRKEGEFLEIIFCKGHYENK